MNTPAIARWPGLLLALTLTACGSSGGDDPPAPPPPPPPPPPPSAELSIADASVAEGDAGVTDLVFALSLSTALATAVSVDFVTADGSAAAGSDYDAASGTLTIPAGDTAAELIVNVAGDPDDEDDETLQVSLANASSTVTIQRGQATGTVIDDDPPPTVDVTGSAVAEDGVTLRFDLTLSALARGDVSLDYATEDGSATAGDDYVADSGTVVIPAGSRSAFVDVELIGDDVDEGDETFDLVISNVSAAATLGIAQAAGTILDDDTAVAESPYRLNDTGVVTCSNAATNGLPCADSGAGTDLYPGQDGESGRDVDVNDDADGVAGFVFTKLDANGDPLADQAADYASAPWDCVRDEITGLVWETKTTDGGLRDNGWTYSWYDASGIGTRSDPGVPNGGDCGGDDCDTQGYLLAVNASLLCGYADWRLATRHELVSLMHFGVSDPPYIDDNYFPQQQTFPYWSRTTTSGFEAVFVNYSEATTGSMDRADALAVRLVRGGSEQ